MVWRAHKKNWRKSTKGKNTNAVGAATNLLYLPWTKKFLPQVQLAKVQSLGQSSNLIMTNTPVWGIVTSHYDVPLCIPSQDVTDGALNWLAMGTLRGHMSCWRNFIVTTVLFKMWSLLALINLSGSFQHQSCTCIHFLSPADMVGYVLQDKTCFWSFRFSLESS